MVSIKYVFTKLLISIQILFFILHYLFIYVHIFIRTYFHRDCVAT